MPSGVRVIHLIQMVSKLGASVLISTLILYITKVLHIPDVAAAGLTGAFFALFNITNLLGGYIGGRYLSYRSLFVICNILELLACLLLTVPNTSFLLFGLALFSSGYGLNISCNCLMTQLFSPEDKSRETAFLLNYSAINFSFYSHTFNMLGTTALAVGILLFICIPFIVRLITPTVVSRVNQVLSTSVD